MKRQELLGACVLLFGALLCWPLLSIPNRPVLVAGVPALVLYLFLVWAAIVSVLVWAARRGRGDDPPATSAALEPGNGPAFGGIPRTRMIEPGDGSAGDGRALGGVGGHVGAPRMRMIEPGDGSAGDGRALGGVGGHVGAPHDK